jgi:hypothetical protein
MQIEFRVIVQSEYGASLMALYRCKAYVGIIAALFFVAVSLEHRAIC